MRFLLDKHAILTSHNTGTYESSKYHKGGGGGQTTTTESGFAKEYKPQIDALLGSAQDLYGSGDLGKVAGLDPTQEDAFTAGEAAAGRQSSLEQALAANANISYDNSAAKIATDTAINRGANEAGQTGNTGGSRNAINNAQIHQEGQSQYRQEQQSALSKALQAQGTSAQAMSNIGAAKQQHAQNVADAPYKGLSQYGSIFGSVAPKESKSTSTGGGK